VSSSNGNANSNAARQLYKLNKEAIINPHSYKDAQITDNQLRCRCNRRRRWWWMVCGGVVLLSFPSCSNCS